MSQNTLALNVVSNIDPRLNYNRIPSVAVTRGPTSIVQTIFNNQSSSPNLTFNCTLNGKGIAVSRKVLLWCQFLITVTGTNTNPNGYLLQPGYYAPRQYPIHSCINTCNLKIGEAGASQQNMNSYINQMNLFNQGLVTDQFAELGTCPTMPDQSQDYAQVSNSLRNPLGTYNDSSTVEQSRGGWPYLYFVTPQVPGNTTAQLVLISAEYLQMSPFCWGKESNLQPAFLSLAQMQVQIALDLTAPLSLVQNQGLPGVVNITNVNAVVTNSNLIVESLTPPLTIPMPQSIVYDYSNVIRYSSNIVSMAPGARNVQFVSNNIQLSSFPKYLLIFVSRSNRSPFYTDAVCPLAGGANSLTPNLTATFNNNSNFLNTFTNFNLYNLSRKAGMTQSFAQFSQFMGSVIAINFQDGSVPMELLDAVSVSKNINLQLTMNVDNYFTDSTPVNAQLNIVAFYGGAFNIIDGFSSTQNALLTPSDVANAKDSDTVSSFVESNSLIGGSFISNAVGAISGFANKLVPAQFKPAVQVAKSVYCNPEVRKGLCGEGLFYPGDYAFHGVGGAMSGGASSGGCGEGCMCSMKGGRKMTKAQLARSLR